MKLVWRKLKKIKHTHTHKPTDNAKWKWISYQHKHSGLGYIEWLESSCIAVESVKFVQTFERIIWKFYLESSIVRVDVR